MAPATASSTAWNTEADATVWRAWAEASPPPVPASASCNSRERSRAEAYRWAGSWPVAVDDRGAGAQAGSGASCPSDCHNRAVPVRRPSAWACAMRSRSRLESARTAVSEETVRRRVSRLRSSAASATRASATCRTFALACEQAFTVLPLHQGWGEGPAGSRACLAATSVRAGCSAG